MDAIFKALADPTRRSLLDRLFAEDGQTLSGLTADTGLTRFGVMKHLAILEAAGLVAVRRHGREKRHFLNRVPIRAVYERWVEKYTEDTAAGLLRLKRDIEGDAMPKPRHMFQIFIEASAERIWAAITQPEYTTQFYHGIAIDSSLAVGSPVRYRLPDGRLAVDGMITDAVPPHRLAMTWTIHYDPERADEPPSHVVWEIEPMGAVCRVTVTQEFPAENKTYRETLGGRMAILSALKTLIETGRPMARPAAV